MSEPWLRFYLWLNIAVPLVFFMAAVYLALHIAFARFVQTPGSPVLWFFGVVTGPLTGPVRRVLAPGTPERRIRVTALAVYVALWLATRALLTWLGPPGMG